MSNQLGEVTSPEPLTAQEREELRTEVYILREKKPRNGSTVYIPQALRVRLGRYIFEKCDGKGHVKSAVICEALEAFLKQKGF